MCQPGSSSWSGKRWRTVYDFLDETDLDLTDGILRKADLPIVDTILCQQFLDVNARSDDMHAGFICAGGQGKEESCYVRNCCKICFRVN